MARKPQRYISDPVSTVCLLCVLDNSPWQPPPCDDSPLHLLYQHRSVELPRQKREKDVSTEHLAHKLSAKLKPYGFTELPEVEKVQTSHMLQIKETDTSRARMPPTMTAPDRCGRGLELCKGTWRRGLSKDFSQRKLAGRHSVAETQKMNRIYQVK